MTDDLDFLALMYGVEEAESPVSPDAASSSQGGPVIPERGIISLPALSAIVRSQAGILANLTKSIVEKERLIRRLEARVRHLETHSRSLGRTVNGLDVEMGNKLDRRDW